MCPGHLWDSEPSWQIAGWRGEGWRRHRRPLWSWEKVKGGTCYYFIIFIIISSTSHSPVWEKNTRKPNLHTSEDAKKLTTILKIHLTNKHPVTELHATTGGNQREPSSVSPVWVQLWSHGPAHDWQRFDDFQLLPVCIYILYFYFEGACRWSLEVFLSPFTCQFVSLTSETEIKQSY